MKLLTFRLQGKMAHFRRYYSNSSALTYSIPPRTTITGIIAGLLGYERDTYYDLFSLDKCKIAVANRAPIKKQVQKMNLLMVKSLNDFNGSKEHHSQTPTEYILPQNIRSGIIDYQVWMYHQDKEVMEKLSQLFQSTRYGYSSYGISLALGSASHLGWLQFEGELEGEEESASRSIELSSVVPAKNITRLEMTYTADSSYRLIKEDIPLEFDQNRRLTEMGKGDMVINLLSNPIKAEVAKHVKLSNGNHITWME
ncbi:type I-B CRISPR-associated protein Cas5b [Tepidibacillus infernus]|uniref:type I-B CRISPR-associated protein Cas5b n=1 Tax=Tepidibacillus infernus TaxID=1806172 RepID=UPI003B6AED16